MKKRLLLFFWLSQASAFNLPFDFNLKSYDCRGCESLSHEPLQLSWPVIQTALSNPTPVEQKSLSYWVDATLTQLNQGVDFYTQAPHAILRIVPLNKAARALHPTFTLQKADQSFSLKDASSLVENENELSDFADKPVALLKLKSELQGGKFTLFTQTPSPYSPNEEEANFRIHVFDHSSTTFLKLKTTQVSYHAGDELIATLRLEDHQQHYPIDNVIAYLHLPNGQRKRLRFSRAGNAVYQAHFLLNDLSQVQGQTASIETTVTTRLNSQPLTRHVHTAFSYAIPSAVITRIDSKQPLSFVAHLQVATSSRYALQALLVKLDEKKRPIALEASQSAAWLERGEAELPIKFTHTLANSTQSPYYLAGIKLIDYGQLKSIFDYNIPIDITRITQ